ncbi:MAG: prepilin-type N-terminal cleavage/methylation domain-containing protein [Desulfamplus sp.]|nr:prepilin-type N-terminal cleavage/methylation domain-containing protein [Desulfamplus sp.]
MQKHHKIKGFTLLEIMVSISILALVLVSVFKIQSAIIRLSIAGEFYSTASHLARQKLADIEQEIRDPSMVNEISTKELSGDFGDDFPDYKWRCAINNLDLSNSEIPEEVIKKGDLQKLKKIKIEISYKDEFSFNISSWRFVQND